MRPRQITVLAIGALLAGCGVTAATGPTTTVPGTAPIAPTASAMGSTATTSAQPSATAWGGNTTTVTVSDGWVFVGEGLDQTTTPVHHLEAFDAGTGTRVWAAPFAAPTGKGLLVGAVADGSVYVTAIDGSLYVLDAATGRVAWTAAIGSRQSPNAAVVGGMLYVTSDDRQVHAFDIASHAELWHVDVRGVPGAPAVVDGRIFVATGRGQVVCLVGG